VVNTTQMGLSDTKKDQFPVFMAETDTISSVFIWLVVEPTPLKNMLVKMGIFPKYG